MLSNLSNNNSGNATKSVVEKRKYEEIQDEIEQLQSDIACNSAAIACNSSSIDALATRVSAVECNCTFDTISTNTIAPKTGSSIGIPANVTISCDLQATHIFATDDVETTFASLNQTAQKAASALSCAQDTARVADELLQSLLYVNSKVDCHIEDMQEEVTTGSVVADSATIDTATIEDLTADEIHNVTNAEIDNITNQTIKSNGKIALPQPMATPSDWYTITVPKDVRAVLKGSYVTENETSVDYNFEVNYGNVYFHQGEMDVVKDILFDEDNVYIRVRSSTDIDYWATYNNTSEEITIEKSSNPEALYDFVPQEKDGIVFKGFNDGKAEFEFPGKVHVKKFLADVIEYDELEAKKLKVSEQLALPVEWEDEDEPHWTFGCGADNQYVSSKELCGIRKPTWKDAATSITENDVTLVSSDAIFNYNGTATDREECTAYPITELGDGTTVHGNHTVECDAEVKGTFTGTNASFTNTKDNVEITTTIDGDITKCIEDDKTYTYVPLDTECTYTSSKPAVVLNGGVLEPTDELTIDCIDADTATFNELFVNGTMHINDTEEVDVIGDYLTLRAGNAASLTSTEHSGVIVNNYNGSKIGALVVDCEGTFQIGTGTATGTTYAELYFVTATSKYYTDSAYTTEVSPVGALTSWDTVEKTSDGKHWTNAVFTEANFTNYEPLLTRNTAANMSNHSPIYWNADCKRADTDCFINLENTCITNADSINSINIGYVCSTCAACNSLMSFTNTDVTLVAPKDFYVCGGNIWNSTKVCYNPSVTYTNTSCMVPYEFNVLLQSNDGSNTVCSEYCRTAASVTDIASCHTMKAVSFVFDSSTPSDCLSVHLCRLPYNLQTNHYYKLLANDCVDQTITDVGITVDSGRYISGISGFRGTLKCLVVGCGNDLVTIDCNGVVACRCATGWGYTVCCNLTDRRVYSGSNSSCTTQTDGVIARSVRGVTTAVVRDALYSTCYVSEANDCNGSKTCVVQDFCNYNIYKTHTGSSCACLIMNDNFLLAHYRPGSNCYAMVCLHCTLSNTPEIILTADDNNNICKCVTQEIGPGGYRLLACDCNTNNYQQMCFNETFGLSIGCNNSTRDCRWTYNGCNYALQCEVPEAVDSNVLYMYAALPSTTTGNNIKTGSYALNITDGIVYVATVSGTSVSWADAGINLLATRIPNSRRFAGEGAMWYDV